MSGRVSKTPLDGMMSALTDDFALVKVGTLKKVIQAVLRQTPIAGRGMSSRETVDGLVLGVDGGVGGAVLPFTPTVVGATGTMRLVTLSPGQVRHAGMTCPPVPNYYGVSLAHDPAPQIEVPQGDDYVIVCRVVYTPTLVDDWVVSAVVTALQILVYNAASVPLDAAGEAFIWLASVSETSVVSNLVGGNCTLTIDDDGSATGVAAVNVFFRSDG